MNEFEGRLTNPSFPISFCLTSIGRFTQASVSLIGMCSRWAVKTLSGLSSFDLLLLSFFAPFLRFVGVLSRAKEFDAEFFESLEPFLIISL